MFFKKHWFLLGLIAVSGLTLVDVTETVAAVGKWCRSHHGPDILICLIFFFSGLILKTDHIKKGLSDIKGTALALVLIFLVAPVMASFIGLLPFDPAIVIGLLLVSAMPTTLSSGVVMTGASGGNIAHALLITILASVLAVFTIPVSLSLMLKVGEGLGIDKGKMMLQIGLLVLAPLLIGMLIKTSIKQAPGPLGRWIPIVNQSCILTIVWMALSQARQTVLNGGSQVFLVILLAFVFHGLLLLAAFLSTTLFGLGPGRRESVIFMGGQKTLPLAVLLQVKFFPDYGLTLAFCVLHHFVHLMMDSYLVGRFAGRANRRS